jgi:geranylgeranyl diphosphate synthase type I
MAVRSAPSTRRRKKKQPPPTAHAKPLASNPFIALAGDLRTDVEARLLGLFDAKLDAARALGREVATMVTAVRDLCLRGGKRYRPTLVVAGARTVTEDVALEPALDIGAALELLQAYFLIHDDWMDRDDTRRGGPSVHAFLSRRFASEHVGACSAVLAGDYAAALAQEALSRVEVEPERAVRLLSCFAQMQADAVLGQQLDIVAKTGNVETTYLLKTASYSVRGPLRLGALLAGASPRQLTALDRFAEPVGLAFQLRDDLLNAFGDPAVTGKPFGSDLRAGKRTLLLAAAKRRVRGRDRELLERVFGNARATDAQVARALAVIDGSGARALVEARIVELVHEAKLVTQQGDMTRGGAELLDGAARALTERRN